jgi:hypothetical protein
MARDPTSLYPRTPENVMNVRYEITPEHLSNPQTMDRLVVFRVFQPNGVVTESSKRIGELHHSFVDEHGMLHQLPTIADVEAAFRNQK